MHLVLEKHKFQVETKEPGLINLADREDRLKKRYDLIATSGKQIHDLIDCNLELFGAKEGTDEWDAYREYIDAMIVDGFFDAIRSV